MNTGTVLASIGTVASPPRTAGPAWVEEALSLPLFFAQVREDALVDLEALRRAPGRGEVLMVASGGCTAAALAARGARRLHCLDPNPAQLALARLKLRLLEREAPRRRLEILGHAPLSPAARAAAIAPHLEALDVPAAALGPPALLFEPGADHAGRYERLFLELRNRLEAVRDRLEALFEAGTLAEQRRAAAAPELAAALDEAFSAVMPLPILVRLFGEAATGNRLQPFDRHFAGRTAACLERFHARDNPYLAQMLLGGYRRGAAAPWLEMPAPGRMPEVVWSQARAEDLLPELDPASFDLIHLSNVLDWQTPESAAATLGACRRLLRPGGLVILRQLNSSLDIGSPGSGLVECRRLAADLHRRDRSFFYRRLYLFRKP